MSDTVQVVILGADSPSTVPGLSRIEDEASLRFANTSEQLRSVLPGAEILLGWDFRADELAKAWHEVDALRWIHWCGAGVDAVLFPGLAHSDAILTNARGVFDRAMAEYVLGLVVAFAKGIPKTLAAQSERRWSYRLTELVANRHALVVGVGSIGREIARMLKCIGMTVTGVGRSARDGDPDFGSIHCHDEIDALVRDADYVINMLPKTAETIGMFGAPQFEAMKHSARFINLGRGATVDEAALINALRDGRIAGAALDVFETEPLPEPSALWDMPNVIVSPHMSGDFHGHEEVLAELFLENFRRYRAHEPLLNVVDKSLGYVKGSRKKG